jgi:hypothetical protein
MYRAVFLFDVADLVPDLVKEAHAMIRRNPNLGRYSIHNLVSAWFYHHLWQDLNLALLDGPRCQFNPGFHFDSLISLLDNQFLEGDPFLSTRLYNHVSMALYPGANPYYESWCSMELQEDHTLALTYDMGPVDYSSQARQG